MDPQEQEQALEEMIFLLNAEQQEKKQKEKEERDAARLQKEAEEKK